MSEQPRRTQAQVRRSRWPGWIWAVPIAALMVVAWLLVRGIARGGEDVTVTFDDAANTQADAKVIYRGLQVGQVSSIHLDKDGRHVRMKLHLNDDMKPFLRQGTLFWLEGAHPDLSEPSSLKAIVAGPTVGVEPGGGAPAKRFVGLEKPPAIRRGEAGSLFILTSDRLGSLGQGADVYYRGLKVGAVTSARLAGPRRFEISAFVRAPYDKLVRTGSRFWNAGAVQLSTGEGGVKARLVSLGAIVSGAIAFDTPTEAYSSPGAAWGAHFPLYPDQGKAENAPTPLAASFAVMFDGAVGGLSEGAPVTLRGFRVGEVASVRLSYDPRSDRLIAPVTLELEPSRLGLAGPAELRAAMARWIRQGLRAQLVQDPPVVGGRSVQLEFTHGARRRPAGEVDGYPQIPAVGGSGDVADIAARADAFASKLDSLPIERIGDNVGQITDHIRAISSSPKLKDAVDHLDASLAELDRTIHKAGPQVAPTVAAMRKAAANAQQAAAAADQLIGGSPTSQNSDLPSAVHELTEAARSIRAMADELQRHPEALIKGKKGGGQ